MCYIYWKGPSLESGKFEFRIQIGFLLLLTSAKLATFSQLLYPSMWNFAEGLCVLKEKTDVGCLVQYPWSLWISGRHFSTGVLLPCLSQIYKQDASLHALYLLNSTNILFLFLRIPVMKWYEKKMAWYMNYGLELLIMYVHEWVIWSVWSSFLYKMWELEIIPKFPSSSNLPMILWFKCSGEVRPAQGSVGSLVNPLNTNISRLIASLWNKPIGWDISVVRSLNRLGKQTGHTARVSMSGYREIVP